MCHLLVLLFFRSVSFLLLLKVCCAHILSDVSYRGFDAQSRNSRSSFYSLLLQIGPVKLKLWHSRRATSYIFEGVGYLLQSGLALSVRNLGTMGVILYATTLVSRLGAATLAAHEIMRQVFIFSIQLFSALDVTAQSLVSLQLGKVRPRSCFHGTSYPHRSTFLGSHLVGAVSLLQHHLRAASKICMLKSHAFCLLLLLDLESHPHCAHSAFMSFRYRVSRAPKHN